MSEQVKHVLLIRHPQSETNNGQLYQAGDQFEVDPLSPEGEWQAAQLAQRFRELDYRPDVILSSSYLRATQLARRIGGVTQSKIIVPAYDKGSISDLAVDDPEMRDYRSLFRELDLPSELEGRNFADEAAQTINDEIKKHLYEPDWHYSDEESLTDIWKRAGEALAYIGQRPEKEITVVTHGGFIKACLSYIVFERQDWDIRRKLETYQALMDSAVTWLDNTGVISLLYYEEEKRFQWIQGDNLHLGGAFGFPPHSYEPKPGDTDASANQLRS